MMRRQPRTVCWCRWHAQRKILSVANLELVLLPGVALAPDVLLKVHVVFERLSGGREGNRGQKLNHQTMKHTHGGWERKGEGREGGGGKQSFSFFFNPKRVKDESLEEEPKPKKHKTKKAAVWGFFFFFTIWMITFFGTPRRERFSKEGKEN